MIDKPIPVTSADFEEVVLNATVPVIVDFWATWCGPCRMVAPILEKVAAEQAEKLLVTKLDVDKNPDIAMKYGVQGIPTMLLFLKGKIAYRQVGAVPEPMLRTIITQFLSIAYGEKEHDAQN